MKIFKGEKGNRKPVNRGVGKPNKGGRLLSNVFYCKNRINIHNSFKPKVCRKLGLLGLQFTKSVNPNFSVYRSVYLQFTRNILNINTIYYGKLSKLRII